MTIKQTHSSALDGCGWPASGRGRFTSGTGLRSSFMRLVRTQGLSGHSVAVRIRNTTDYIIVY